MKLVIEGNSMEEISTQVLSLAKEMSNQPAIVTKTTQVYSMPLADLVSEEQDMTPSTRTAEGHVVSGGQVWKPSERAGNAYYPEAINDSRGMPFDQRIHVSPEKKNKDGSWLNKRVGKEKVAEVEAELMDGRPATPVTPAPATKTLSPLPGMTQEQYAGHVNRGNNGMPPVLQAAPVAAAPAPVVEPVMGMSALHNVDTFKKNLPTILMELTNSGAITQQYIADLKAWLQVPELVNVISDQGKVQALFDTWVANNFIKRA